MIKKIITTIVLCSLVSITQAEYKISIGMTDKHNGPLPDSSIVIKNKTSVTETVPPVVEPPVVVPERCFYTPNVYSWKTAVGTAILQILWNGEMITGYPAGQNITTFDLNGYRYTKDAQQTFSGPPLFKICRDAI